MVMMSVSDVPQIPMNTSFLFLLADDIGWADFGYNGGIAATPHIDRWAKAHGSVKMHDFHSGGTVCSPTRASVLTGRNHFRDCVDYVYCCSDMTECVPNFQYAPQKTFTVADAVRMGRPEAKSIFVGKWHLGSLYNDSEALGGITSSPTSHGFDHFNATVGVAPTVTANAQCRVQWNRTVDYGHYGKPTHCSGEGNPGGGGLPAGCCFNYWADAPGQEHGVVNQSTPTPYDDSYHVTSAFSSFVRDRAGRPFFAELAFHNCHIPFIASSAARKACASGLTCTPPAVGAPPYTDAELDYFGCLTALDAAVGRVLATLDEHSYRMDTLVWFTTDNGPEVNCRPSGICGGSRSRPTTGGAFTPGSAGLLRGRKRDVWEGGHRVPGILAWPRYVGARSLESWATATTMDFLPTVLEVVGNVSRPAVQASWPLDGTSLLPVLRGEALPARGLAWAYMTPNVTAGWGYGYRYGRWKMVVGGESCREPDCLRPMLYNLDDDLGERVDLAAAQPDVLNAMLANFSEWQQSIYRSRKEESQCAAPVRQC